MPFTDETQKVETPLSIDESSLSVGGVLDLPYVHGSNKQYSDKTSELLTHFIHCHKILQVRNWKSVIHCNYCASIFSVLLTIQEIIVDSVNKVGALFSI